MASHALPSVCSALCHTVSFQVFRHSVLGPSQGLCTGCPPHPGWQKDISLQMNRGWREAEERPGEIKEKSCLGGQAGLLTSAQSLSQPDVWPLFTWPWLCQTWPRSLAFSCLSEPGGPIGLGGTQHCHLGDNQCTAERRQDRGVLPSLVGQLRVKALGGLSGHQCGGCHQAASCETGGRYWTGPSRGLWQHREAPRAW